jgi:hypothetical protein
MKIGDDYDIGRIGIADWRQLARACAIDEGHLVTLLAGMANELPEKIAAAREQALSDGLSQSIVAPLADQLLGHVAQRRATISGVTSAKSHPIRKARRRAAP